MVRLNLDEITRAILPIEKRATLRITWLKALLTHLDALNLDFKNESDIQILEETYTAQTIALQDMLNDKLDIEQRRITIRHSLDSSFYIYREAENIPKYIYRESELPNVAYIFRESEGGNLTVDFEVVLGFEIEGQVFHIYRESEENTSYIYRESETDVSYIFRESENKFLSEITALVNNYKAAGFSFQIVE